MGSRASKSALFEAIALMGKAAASPVRLELLDLLTQAPRAVDELARACDQSTANTSQHLLALHAAGMVTRTREGTSTRYGLAGDEVLLSWLALRDASIARLGDVERAAREHLGGDVDAIGRGPFCAYAQEAVRQIRATGREARRLQDGRPGMAAGREEHQEAASSRLTEEDEMRAIDCPCGPHFEAADDVLGVRS